MKRTLIGYASVFLLAFLVFLVAGLPASVALERVTLPQGLEVGHADGSIWAGQATLADAHGPLGTVDWRLDVFPLLLGRVGADLRFDGPLGQGRGHVRLDEAAVDIEDLELSLDVLAVTSRPPALFPTRGQLVGTIAAARLGGAGITRLDGQLSLQQTGLTFPMELALGDFMVDFNTSNDVITGTITSSEEPLSARGQVRVVDGMRYQLNLTLRPDAQADPALRDALALAGRPAADGSVTLVQRGNLSRWLGN